MRSSMRGILLILLLGGFFSAFPVSGQEKSTEGVPLIGSIPRVGLPLPAYQWRTLGGQPFTPGTLRDQITVLLLWTPGCPGAAEIAEDLPELMASIEDAGADLFVVSLDPIRSETEFALDGVISFDRVVMAEESASVFTNPDVSEHFEGPIEMTVMVPVFVVIDASGVVRHSQLWEGPESVLRELRSNNEKRM